MNLDLERSLIEFNTKEGLSVVKLENVSNIMYDNKGNEGEQDWVIGFTSNGQRFGITCESEDEAIDMYQQIKKFM